MVKHVELQAGLGVRCFEVSFFTFWPSKPLIFCPSFISLVFFSLSASRITMFLYLLNYARDLRKLKQNSCLVIMEKYIHMYMCRQLQPGLKSAIQGKFPCPYAYRRLIALTSEFLCRRLYCSNNINANSKLCPPLNSDWQERTTLLRVFACINTIELTKQLDNEICVYLNSCARSAVSLFS